MKPVTKLRLKTAGFIIFISGSFYGSGPSLVHLRYRMVTTASEKQSMQERYTTLANQEAFDKSLDEPTKNNLRAERLKLYYWFHARGWPIDEGDEPRDQRHRWRELMAHWKG